MTQINLNSRQAIRRELMSGEQILWAGQPSTHLVFRKEDLFLAPFSLVWGAFAIFLEATAAGLWPPGRHLASPWMFAIWGIPVVLAAQYLIWGRFLLADWKKRRTHYAVTNRRVIVVQDGSTRQMASAYLDELPAVIKDEGSNGFGTLRFAPRQSWQALWDGMAVGDTPLFRDIDDVQSVYDLVAELRLELEEEALTLKAS